MPPNSKWTLYQARLMRCLNLEQVSTVLTLSVYCIEILAGAVGGGPKKKRERVKEFDLLKKVENCSCLGLKWTIFQVALLLDCQEPAQISLYELICVTSSQVISFNYDQA